MSTMPTFYGEKVEMRLLESSQKPLSLEELGMSPEVAKIVTDNLSKVVRHAHRVRPDRFRKNDDALRAHEHAEPSAR